jgi:hypothetical protein
MHRLLQKLTGGDRRSIGNVAGVIHDVSKKPALFEVLFDGLTVDDPLIRMRAADAIEKISADQPALLRPFKKKIIRLAGESRQQEVRWHMAQIIVRPAWTTREKDQVVEYYSTTLMITAKSSLLLPCRRYLILQPRIKSCSHALLRY